MTEQMKAHGINDKTSLPKDLHEESLADKNEEEHFDSKSKDSESISTSTIGEEHEASNQIPTEIIISTDQKDNAASISSTIMPGYITTVAVCKRHKEYFCQFAKVLVRYLQLVYPSLYLRAKDIIRECDKLKREGRFGYEILAFSIQFNLRRLVGKEIWAKAAEYHTKWLMNHYKNNSTYSLECEAKVAARRIVRIASQPLVHPSNLCGYRGRTKREKETSIQKQNYSNDDSCIEEIDSDLGSITKDYVVIQRNKFES
ncbi:predicted protein [Chaetoceros tenuissimus]|uniref:Uncharacterized protein n=1 Tax=Chaetoceros tenuissimus TaxID=426638 RepID=A0AAD3DF91_9STRA|nr:predicted protein [Chaetoceros tenuissimus]